LERETGIEPVTSSLGSWRSTAELLPLDIGRLPFCFAQDKRVSLLFCCVVRNIPARILIRKILIAGVSMSADSLVPKYNSRRNFLRAGATATLAAAACPAFGSTHLVKSPVEETLLLDFLPHFELDEFTIDDVQRHFQSGQYK
jgi:hypothetical protein